MFTTIAYASTPGLIAVQAFVDKFNEVILFPVITLLVAVALLVFVWGCFQYIINAANPAARADGQKHIMWGIVGLFVMLSAYAILSIAANTFGLQPNLDCADDPSLPGCNEVFTVPNNFDPSPGSPNPNFDPSPGSPNPNFDPSPGSPNPNVNP